MSVQGGPGQAQILPSRQLKVFAGGGGTQGKQEGKSFFHRKEHLIYVKSAVICFKHYFILSYKQFFSQK